LTFKQQQCIIETQTTKNGDDIKMSEMKITQMAAARIREEIQKLFIGMSPEKRKKEMSFINSFRVCPICKNPFKKPKGIRRQKHCSNKCSKIASNIRHLEYYHKTKKLKK
jgi:hypothetical protein